MKGRFEGIYATSEDGSESTVLTLRPETDLSSLIPHTAAWREWRRQGIGGSDAPIITGDDPFTTQLTLWLDKCGYLDRGTESDDDSPRWWGRRLEDSVIDRFQLDNPGLLVVHKQLCVEHHIDRWRRATLDGLIYESIDQTSFGQLPGSGRLPGGSLGIFEGKTTSKWSDWSDGPPIYTQIQVQHNLDVAQADIAWVGVLFTAPVINFRHYVIERDESITGPLRELEAAFWRRVQEHDAPSAQREDLSALKQAYREAAPEAIELATSPMMPSAREIVDELVTARADKSAAERREETAQALLAQLLQEHETGTIGGVPVVNWKRHEKQYVDIDAMRLAHPQIVERFTSKRPYRQFTVPKEKNVDESR